MDAIAQIWAEATAARDRDPDVAELELARPLMEEALAKPDALAMVALDGERVIAFALAHAETDVPKIQYVGVAPERWGEGLAGRVLDAVGEELGARGYASARLNVYTDNPAAISAYERHGWKRADGPPKPHSRTGKPEYTYMLELRGPDSAP